MYLMLVDVFMQTAVMCGLIV